MIRFITFIIFIIFITSPPARAQTPASAEASAGKSAAEAAIDTSSQPAAVTPKEDLTQPSGEAKGRLERLIEGQNLEPAGPGNFVRHAIRQAVAGGVPANTVVLLILFPLIVMAIAAARHLLGLKGFGIFTPAVIAVAFLATGLGLGLGLFLGILAIAAAARLLTRRLRLQYLPRLSLLILFICIGILAAFLAGATQGLTLAGQRLDIKGAINVGIFPLLLLILLTETFISAEISHGGRFAVRLTLETLILAVISYLIMDLRTLQEWVLLHPEVTIVSLMAGNILLGRFTGLRMLEYWRFRELLRK